MFKSITNSFIFKNSLRSTPTQKVALTLFVLFIFRFGNTIPLAGVDQEALRRSFFEQNNRNALMQIINMYSGGGGTTLLSPFSLGIIPFINASILLDLLTAVIPSLEKLQSEEGEFGKQKLLFYKKIITFLFSIGQSIFLIFYLKSYFYSSSLFEFSLVVMELVSGAMIIVWLSNIIDNRGIGNGTSIIIFTNIIVTLITKNILNFQTIDKSFVFQLIFLAFLVFLICLSQTARINIFVVSARQLAFLENAEKTSEDQEFINDLKAKENALSLKFNQAGIFPIIIASNLIPLLSYFNSSSGKFQNIFSTALYYIFVVAFNYFYTIIFWDPEKIAEQLRKASVSIVGVTPGKNTAVYLERIVRSSSTLGGIFLCLILIIYDLVKQLSNSSLLNQINISSLIILVGVAFEVQKSIRSLYKNVI